MLSRIDQSLDGGRYAYFLDISHGLFHKGSNASRLVSGRGIHFLDGLTVLEHIGLPELVTHLYDLQPDFRTDCPVCKYVLASGKSRDFADYDAAAKADQKIRHGADGTVPGQGCRPV